MKTLREYLADQPCAWNGKGEWDTPIRQIQADSRKVGPQDLFVAVSGAVSDGHQFIRDAVRCGAKAVVSERFDDFMGELGIPQFVVSDSRKALSHLVSRFYGEPSRKLKLIGVTGTNGKTTTTFLIQHLLASVHPTGLIGTIHYDDGKTLTSAVNTTPGPERLHELFSRMAAGGVTHCVLEVSSHALDQERTSGLSFSSAVFTNLTQDHLDYHSDLEAYYQAKRKLFWSDTPPAHSLVCQDDSYGIRLIHELKDRPAAGFGFQAPADYHAFSFRSDLYGMDFELTHKEKSFPVHAPLIFKHNAMNVLAALSVLSEEGYPLGELIPRLLDFPGVPGRMERIDEGQDFYLFVDYAHTPDAIARILSYARSSSSGRIITVFGCGGDRDRLKRPIMGQIANQYSDLVVLTSDNPRTEHPRDILREIEKGIEETGRRAGIFVIEDRNEAVGFAASEARAGDLVFIFGKGHEQDQIIGREKFPFRDQEVAREWIQKKCTHLRKPQASAAGR